MGNSLEYKGYHTKIEYDSETMLLYGKVEGISDLITFESDDPANVEQEFQAAVDDYLEFCSETGKEPETPAGELNVRLSPELHEKLARRAEEKGETLDESIQNAITEYVSGDGNMELKLEQTIKLLTEALMQQSVYKDGGHTSISDKDVISFDGARLRLEESS